MIKQGSNEWWSNLATYLVFSVTLGIFGMDRFYKGEVGWGVVKLITAGGLGVWYLVDICFFGYRFGQTGQWTKAQVSGT